MVGLQGSVLCTQLLRVLAALLAISKNGYLLFVPSNMVSWRPTWATEQNPILKKKGEKERKRPSSTLLLICLKMYPLNAHLEICTWGDWLPACACASIYTHMYVCVETRGQPQVLMLRSCPPWLFETKSPWDLGLSLNLDWLTCPPGICHSVSPALRITHV